MKMTRKSEVRRRMWKGCGSIQRAERGLIFRKRRKAVKTKVKEVKEQS